MVVVADPPPWVWWAFSGRSLPDGRRSALLRRTTANDLGKMNESGDDQVRSPMRWMSF